ncbi:MAG: metallophosphoesterase [Alcaligenaceae bacterium]|nr:MAG: metallophosphoesterase [Alcaligenaceae bacterium]
MGYDIIGDVHGQADKLHALLEHMGYEKREGTFRHPEQTAIFVGDLIDRGPRQMESVWTVRRMVDARSALCIMGNHEFNAIAWHMRDPEHDNEYLRPRSGKLGAKNRHQHAAFLSEIEHDIKLHADVIDWFMTLPLWLDLPGLRVVHACWHDAYMEELRPHLTSNLQIDPNLMVDASREGAMAFRTIEAITKGLEVGLPTGHSFQDKDGHTRFNVRVRWWDATSAHYRDLALLPDELRERLPAEPIMPDLRCEYDNKVPVFFGHYWMTGQPALQSTTIACVDYSAAKRGPLVAYRWRGESMLDAANFVAVGAEK